MKGVSEEAAVRERLIEERRHVMADITGLAEQVSSEEVDQKTAGRLLARYSEELRGIEEQLENLPIPEPAGSSEPVPAHPGDAPQPPDADQQMEGEPPVEDRRSLRRAITGSLALLAVITVAIVWIANAAFPDPEPAEPPAPGPLLSSEELGTIDPGQLVDASIDELAEIVETHPESVTARLLLADRYLELGENQLALEHYLLVEAADPGAAEESRAAARIGYLAYMTGQLEAARDYIDRAVSLDPLNGEAKLFLGMVLLYGFDDAAAALPLLEDVAALPDLPDSVRAEVATALEDARSSPGGG